MDLCVHFEKPAFIVFLYLLLQINIFQFNFNSIQWSTIRAALFGTRHSVAVVDTGQDQATQ